MTPKQIDEDRIEDEMEREEQSRRQKEQIGDEKGIVGAEIVEEIARKIKFEIK